MKRPVPFLLAAATFLFPFIASAQTYFRRVPVVTQVQGAAFFRTSITIGNDHRTAPASVTLLLSYRSPVDGTFQTKGLAVSAPLAPHQSVFIEDVIQEFKNAGVIRSQDATVGLFGTLLVKYDGLQSDDDGDVVARTYSAAPGGGTNGIAYAGRVTDETGASRIHATLRNGTFGNDGNTRANIGFVNEGAVAADVQVVYYDALTGATLKGFKLSDVAHHLLEPGEVFQISNVFADSSVPAGTKQILVDASTLTSGNLVSGYAVQLDATTNDGSFFLMTEYD